MKETIVSITRNLALSCLVVILIGVVMAANPKQQSYPFVLSGASIIGDLLQPILGENPDSSPSSSTTPRQPQSPMTVQPEQSSMPTSINNTTESNTTNTAQSPSQPASNNVGNSQAALQDTLNGAGANQVAVAPITPLTVSTSPTMYRDKTLSGNAVQRGTAMAGAVVALGISFVSASYITRPKEGWYMNLVKGNA